MECFALVMDYKIVSRDLYADLLLLTMMLFLCSSNTETGNATSYNIFILVECSSVSYITKAAVTHSVYNG